MYNCRVKICGIYGLWCRVTKKWYIGQSVNIKKRWWVYKKGRLVRQPKLNNAIKKYGWDAFETIVLETYPVEIADAISDIREIYWVAELDGYTQGYNCTRGGGGKYSHERRVESNKKIWECPERRRKASERTKLQWADKNFVAKNTAANKLRWSDPELLERHRKTSTKIWSDPERRRKSSERATEQMRKFKEDGRKFNYKETPEEAYARRKESWVRRKAKAAAKKLLIINNLAAGLDKY